MNNSIITSNSLKQSKDTYISYFKNLMDKQSSSMHISDVCHLIVSGAEYSNIIQKIRSETNKAKIAALKKRLPAVTFSGLFQDKRKLENLVQYSNFICLDFDNVKDLGNTKNILNLDPFSHAIFISPSGKGLKLIIKILCDKKEPIKFEHTKIFNSLSYYFLKKYGLEIDKSGKDITRLTFLSEDPDLFLNENSEVWNLNYFDEFKFNLATLLIEKKETFKEGNRNNFVFKLASICCKQNIEKEYCLKKIMATYKADDFLPEEIRHTVESAYTNKDNKKNDSNPQKTSKGISFFARVENYLTEKYDLRYNEVRNLVEYRGRDTKDKFKELNENSLFRELHLNNLAFSFNKLGALLLSDFVPRYNPLRHYFESLGEWSETEEDFISKLAGYLPIKDWVRFNKHFKKMLVRCIACALDDNFFNKQVFVLVHDQQNSGKSTFCRWLCPPALGDYITENINTDKDSLIALSSNLFINMDELATLTKTEINGLKSFISKDKINVRIPFGKRPLIQPRRANFVGSTNKDEFLTDETGSVRWLCFELTATINFKYKDEVNINDIWRQAFSLYKAGFKYQLTPEEIVENEIANRTFQVHSSEMDLIQEFLIPSSKEKGGIFLTPTEIHQKIVKRDFILGTKMTVYTIGRAMKMLDFNKESKYAEGRKYSQKGYYVKEF